MIRASARDCFVLSFCDFGGYTGFLQERGSIHEVGWRSWGPRTSGHIAEEPA